MEPFFKFIHPGEISPKPHALAALFHNRSELAIAVGSAENLAVSASAFFRGAYPIQAPWFWWGESIRLPWFEEYWKVSDDGKSMMLVPIQDEVEQIARSLTALAKKRGEEKPWDQMTYSSRSLCTSAKLKIQGLAVEAMLAAEGFLSCISKKEFIESMPWLVSANTNIFECCCQAQYLLGLSISENARQRAKIRHRENHAMKEEVFIWLDSNMAKFKSMDAAAEAIIKQSPIVFRTARDWVGQWKKVRSASRP